MRAVGRKSREDGIIHKPEQAYYNMGDNKSHLCGFRALIIGETVGRWTVNRGPCCKPCAGKSASATALAGVSAGLGGGSSPHFACFAPEMGPFTEGKPTTWRVTPHLPLPACVQWHGGGGWCVVRVLGSSHCAR